MIAEQQALEGFPPADVADSQAAIDIQPAVFDRCVLAALLVTGIVLAALTEAIAGTVLSLARADIIGDTHTTPDEFAWLDVSYTATKFVGFLAAAPLLDRLNPIRVIAISTLAMGTACALAAFTDSLELLVALRTVQGLSGGVLLVAGQAIIFQAFSRHRQPMLQATFAIGAVVAPATMVPALQGWLVDSESWKWIFFIVALPSLASVGFLLISDPSTPVPAERRPVDWSGLTLASIALFAFTYVFTQGSRWDWFEEPRIVGPTITGTAALLAFIGQQVLAGDRRMLNDGLFRSDDFCFALVVSFVAGAALFGSAYLIPAFAVSALSFTPTDAGRLLLPSSALFVAALFIAARLMQVHRLPPIATVPFGIVLIMIALWMLSGSTGESGMHDMMAAVLVRGLGLGFLFLAITLVAFSKLDCRNLASGIGLFNTGRQLGGLIGVAALQTMINHETAANLAVLGANVTAGEPSAVRRLMETTALFVSRGLDQVSAGGAAANLLARSVAAQSTVIAFDTAFIALAMLFVIAAPCLIAVKIALARYSKRRTI